MSRFSFLRLSSAIGALSVMFGTVSDAADIPGPDFDAYNEFCDSGRLSPAQLLSESFHTHTTEFCPVPPLFCAHRDALIYMPKIREVVEQMLANPIGNVIIRCLLANFRHGGSRIEIRKGVMHDDGDGHSIPVAGVGLPDATGRISISCFSDGRDMFQSRDLGDYIAGIAIDPSNGVQYIALPTLSGDEQFAHALLYVIRIVRKTDLNINQAPLMLKFFSEELKQRLDASTASFMECLWQSDEQFEVITGKKLQGEGFFALSEVSYALGKGEPLCYLRAFGVSMIPYEGGGKLEAGKDLVQYYEGTDLVEFLGGRRIPPITRKVYADSLFASREVLYELQQGERRKKVKHPYLKLLGL